MKEKDIQQKFKELNQKEGIFELKLCKKTSLPFKNIADHQIEALLAGSSEKGLYHKISDSPVSWGGQRFTKPKPFDCFFLKNQPAYIVICWYQPRIKKDFHYIPIKNFLDMQRNADRKSITEEMSKEAATFIMRGNRKLDIKF